MKEFPKIFKSLPKEIEDGFHFYKFDPSLCDVFFTEMNPNTVLPAHTHPQDVINLVTKGTFFISLNGIEQTIHPGEWVVIPKDTIHSVRTTESTNIMEFWFKK